MRIVSHEFRTPLAIIRNSAEMIGLAGDAAPAAVRERIAGIGEALDRLFALIDRFMADDREAGFQPEPIEVGLLLESVRLHFAMTDQDGRLNISIADRSLRLFADRSEEHTSELQSLMRISYAVFCLKKKKQQISTIPKHK